MRGIFYVVITHYYGSVCFNGPIKCVIIVFLVLFFMAEFENILYNAYWLGGICVRRMETAIFF